MTNYTTQLCTVQALHFSAQRRSNTRCFMIKMLKWLSSSTRTLSTAESKLRKRMYLTTNVKSVLTTLPTNFHADELVRGEPQHENRILNWYARI